MAPTLGRPLLAVILGLTFTTGALGGGKGRPAPAIAEAAGRVEQAASGSTGSSAVPAQYQPLYASLQAELDSTRASLSAESASGASPIFGAELLVADGNRGAALLSPLSWTATLTSLDALQSLGLQGATVAIKYPLFTPADQDYQGYVQ